MALDLLVALVIAFAGVFAYASAIAPTMSVGKQTWNSWTTGSQLIARNWH